MKPRAVFDKVNSQMQDAAAVDEAIDSVLGLTQWQDLSGAVWGELIARQSDWGRWL